MNFFTRTDKSFLGQWWWTVDRVTLAILFTICIFGIVLVTAASPAVANRIDTASPYHFIIRHIVFLVPSIGLMIGLSMTNLQQVWRAAVIILGVSVFLMMLVPVIGDEVKGAQRWIGLGPLSLQPSELAKPSFIVVAAWLIARQKEKPEFHGIVFAGALYGLVVLLLVLQPDMGMTFIVTASFLTIIFLAGLPFRWIILLLGIVIAAAVLAYFSFSHVQSRFDRFVNPESGDTYQIDRSLSAFRHGGLLGTGAGQGTVKMHIPDAHADFIFAVAGEELGMLMTVLLVGLYGYVILRGYNRIMDTDNIFIILASGGILTLFGLQALINMGSSIHLLPTKGMTLPFISYGGSSLLSSGIAMGMLLALTRRQSRSGIARSGLSIRPIGGAVK
ncbi:MAG: putative lipid II flippase FtsW [Micavibrio aeruginosavorus]|uniref:Probable peptidoglycan glycosyltransferase FtsW n=1 Tax=Micavibrio aeruginosavorus TaxID=349221 RepID=A0A2W5MW62_9BACT|nr:MAG: putative lipid II flippase FtsW [Micavibrio aeruginosavorus]